MIIGQVSKSEESDDGKHLKCFQSQNIVFEVIREVRKEPYKSYNLPTDSLDFNHIVCTVCHLQLI